MLQSKHLARKTQKTPKKTNFVFIKSRFLDAIPRAILKKESIRNENTQNLIYRNLCGLHRRVSPRGGNPRLGLRRNLCRRRFLLLRLDVALQAKSTARRYASLHAERNLRRGRLLSPRTRKRKRRKKQPLGNRTGIKK